jgi:hypothetical protein
LFWILLKFGLRNTTGLRKWLLRLKHDFCFTSARRSNEQTCFPPFFQKEMAARPSPSNTRRKHYKPSSMNACHSPSWKQVTSKSQQ